MFAFIVNRILQAIPVMLAVALISFAMFAYVGDPVAMGLALMAMLERSWLLQQLPAYPARRAQMVDAATSVILALLR